MVLGFVVFMFFLNSFFPGVHLDLGESRLFNHHFLKGLQLPSKSGRTWQGPTRVTGRRLGNTGKLCGLQCGRYEERDRKGDERGKKERKRREKTGREERKEGKEREKERHKEEKR